MPSSQEFREALQAGKIQEAFTLALTEAVELKITTWVSSSESDSDRATVSPEIVSQTTTRGSVEEAKPGHRLRTNINLMQGDIEHEIGDRFLNNRAYHELLQFHLTQVDKGQQIIEQNIHSLQKIFSLVTSLNNPPAKSPDSSPLAIALEQAEAEPDADIEAITVSEEESLFEPEFLATEEAETLNGNVLDSLITAEEQLQSERSDVSATSDNPEIQDLLAEETPQDLLTPDLSPLTSETELDSLREDLELTQDWIEEEPSTLPLPEEQSPEDLSLETPALADEETASTQPTSPRSPEAIVDPETADNQTEAFIDTLFSSDDWIDEELPEAESQLPSREETNQEIPNPREQLENDDWIDEELPEAESQLPSREETSQEIPNSTEQLEIEGWDTSSNLRFSEAIASETENIEATNLDETVTPPETATTDLFEFEDDMAALSESDAELDLDDWEFSAEGTENESSTETEIASNLESLEIEELTSETDSETSDLEALASELTANSQPEQNPITFTEEIDNPWDAPEPDRSSLEALSLEEEENVENEESEEEEEEEDEDWGDFVKFVEQDLPTTETTALSEPQTPPTPQPTTANIFELEEDSDREMPLTENPAETSTGKAIAPEEEWDAPSSEIDPFATSHSDTESYTSIVEEDWEEFAIEELEPYPKAGSWNEPLIEETVATASIDEILDDPPELINEEISEFSESELDRAWDEELFGDEFNFDISLSDEADMSSELLEIEAKQETQPNP
jgi:hypothetical protein